MNKIQLLLVFPFVLFSCIGKYKSDAQQVIISEKSIGNSHMLGFDTSRIDANQSRIHWKGTKMRGAGKHEGGIKLKSGFFTLQNGQLTGGTFTVDMQSIEVTDIPKYEPIPRKNLIKHLKSADFFDVETYPVATFEITNVKKLSGDSIKVYGNLRIKDISQNIGFTAIHLGSTFSTTFTFDRFQWNIAYKGNWVDKTLVDKEVELKITLFKKHKP